MRKIIRRRIRRKEGGVNVAADVDAVVSVNEPGETSSSARVRSRRRIVQRSGPGDPGQQEDRPRTEGGE